MVIVYKKRPRYKLVIFVLVTPILIQNWIPVSLAVNSTMYEEDVMNKNTMYLKYIHQLRKYKKHLRMYALCGHFGPTYDL